MPARYLADCFVGHWPQIASWLVGVVAIAGLALKPWGLRAALDRGVAAGMSPINYRASSIFVVPVIAIVLPAVLLSLSAFRPGLISDLPWRAFALLMSLLVLAQFQNRRLMLKALHDLPPT
jgi:hypothetical protein